MYVKGPTEKEIDFDKIFTDYYTGLCLFSAKITGDMDMTRSLVQDVYLYFWENKNRIKIHSSIKSYLYQMVRNRSIDYLNQRKKENTQVMDVLPEVISNDEINNYRKEAILNQRINEAIDKLPSQCKTVFLLSKCEGLKYREIACKLNLSIKTVEMHMGNSLKKLRLELADLQMLMLFMIRKIKKS